MVDPAAFFLTGLELEQIDPARLAETTAAHAFQDAALSGDGSMNFDEFRRWYSR